MLLRKNRLLSLRLVKLLNLRLITKIILIFTTSITQKVFLTNVLFNVKNKIQRSNVEFLIRSGFRLENIQSALDVYNEPLKNSRYWTTDPIQTKSFNNYVYFTIRESILKRVINNGLTGSSWHFNRFLYINIKIIQVNDQLIR